MILLNWLNAFRHRIRHRRRKQQLPGSRSGLASTPGRSKRPSRLTPQQIELLEERVLLSAVTVTTAADVLDGDTSSISNLLVTPGDNASNGTGGGLTPADSDRFGGSIHESVLLLAEAAEQRWIEAGISPTQLKALNSIEYSVRDLGGNNLGASDGTKITIDDNAGGNLWFVDATPALDEEFTAELVADTTTLAHAKSDLLTVLLHEQGHVLGLDGLIDPENSSDVMNEALTIGQRRLPLPGQADEAEPGSLEAIHYLTSNTAGSSQPLSVQQAYNTLTYSIALQGIYPSQSLTAGDPHPEALTAGSDPVLGSIMQFAGSFAPNGWALAQGQLLSISTNTALFSILGTTYGGDGASTFGLPDLRGRVPVGTGTGPGLTPVTLGQKFGDETVTLAAANLPAHDHGLDSGSPTSATGSASPQSFDNRMPSLGLTPVVATQGIYPSQNLDPALGGIFWFAGNFAPAGYAKAEGQLLPIAQNTALFSLLGTIYGGDGVTTFALPDLRGRTPIHYGAGPGLSSVSLGQQGGTESVTLTEGTLPSHTHGIPGTGDSTQSAGGDQSIDLRQPYLALNYQIALTGIYPSASLLGNDTSDEDESAEVAGLWNGDELIALQDANSLVELLVDQGIERWLDAGISAEQAEELASATYRIEALPTGTLASVVGPDLVVIDADASNGGWFVDFTPDDDVEFGSIDPETGELLATDLDARHTFDLLTTIMHEQGHLLGFSHALTRGTVMSGILQVGGRLNPVAADLLTGTGPHDSSTTLSPGSDFIAQVVMFGGNFAVRDYAQTDGQLLPISQNVALFSLVGTIYGGDGETTFGLPDLRGRAVVGVGQGPGLSNFLLGQEGGLHTTSLSTAQMPAHTHEVPDTEITLDGSNNLVITDINAGTSSDDLTISTDGTNVIVTDSGNILSTSISGSTGSGTNTVTIPLSQITGSEIQVNTLGGDDSLNIDLSSGNFGKAISFNAGAADGGDNLTVTGGTFASVAVSHVNATDGSITITGNSLISYTGLEGGQSTLNLSGITATDVSLTYTTGDDDIDLDDAEGPTDLQSSTAVDTRIGTVTGTLSVFGGDGNDTYTVTALASSFPANLLLNGGVGADPITVNGSISLAANKFIEIRGDNVSIAAPLTTSGTGNITLVSTSGITLSGANADITTSGGTVTIDADANDDGTGTLTQDEAGSAIATGAGDVTVTAAAASLTGSTTTDAGAVSITTTKNISLNTGASITTVDGGITLTANAAGTAPGTFVGISVNGASIESTGSGLVTLNARGGGNLAPGVVLSNFADVTSDDGAISITGTGGLGNTNSASMGVRVVDSVVESTGAATILITGNGTSGFEGANHHGIQVTGTTAAITSITGNITLDGDAQFGRGGNSFGVSIENGAGVTGTGAAEVDITGVNPLASGAGSDGNGIVISGTSSRVTTSSGTLSLTGSGADQASSEGVVITSDGEVRSASGDITISGTVKNGGSNPTGVGILYNSATPISTSGTINLISGITRGARIALSNGSISGTAGVTLKAANAVPIDLGSAVDTATNKLELSDAELDLITTSGSIVIGSAGAGAVTFSSAIDLANADTLEIITGGTVNGDGISPAFTDTNLAITAGLGVGTTSPLNIAVSNFEADGGTGGINIANTGNVTVGGVSGGLTGLSATDSNISLTAASSITVTEAINSGTGNIILNATDDVTINTSVTVTGSGSIDIDAGRQISVNAGGAVASASGAITLDANASGTATGYFSGVFVANTATVSSTTGDITVTGRGGDTVDNGNHGAQVEDTAAITSLGGNITLTGQAGGAGATNFHEGVIIGGNVTTTGSGNITLNGTGGSTGGVNIGVDLISGTIAAVNGTVTLNGVSGVGGSDAIRLVNFGGGSAVVTTTGSGAIVLTANESAGTGVGLNAGGAGSAIGGALTTGNISITTDTIALGIPVQSTGGLTISPRTASTTIGIGGGGAGTLNLDDTELAKLTDGFSSITINGEVQETLSEDFTIAGIPASLEANGATVNITDNLGDLQFGGVGNASRSYVRTVAGDYFSKDFVAEVTVTVPAAGSNSVLAFFGMGEGTPDTGGSNEPINPGIHTRLHNDLNAGLLHASDNGVSTAFNTGGDPGSGTHRIRLTWDAAAQQARLQVDTDYIGGAFTADQDSGLIDGSDNEFNGTNTHIYFGGNENLIYDDFSVTSPVRSAVDVGSSVFTDPVTIVGSSINDAATGTDITAPSVTLTGTIAPGQSPGILVVDGDFSFADNSTFEIEVGGTTPGTAVTNHDQLAVTGTVTIGSNVALTTLPFNGFAPIGGESITIIDNDGFEDAITGTFQGLAEGATLTSFLGSPYDATISYVGGAGNDVVLTVQPLETSVEVVGNDLIVTDANGGNTADNLTITADGMTVTITDNNGNLIDLIGPLNAGTGDGTSSVTVPLSVFTGSLNINTLAGDDLVTVDGLTLLANQRVNITTGAGNDAVTFGTGATTLSGTGGITADAETVNVNAAISTPGSDLLIAADNLAINAAINVGNNFAEILESTPGTSIGIGTGAGTLSITNAELDLITAGGIDIGFSSSGTVSIGGAVAHAGDAFFLVETGLGIVFESGASWTTTDGSLAFFANELENTGDFRGFDATDATIQTNGTGSIDIYAIGGDSADNEGVFLLNSDISSTATGSSAGTIAIYGASYSTGGEGAGVRFTNGSVVESVDGTILINGVSDSFQGVYFLTLGGGTLRSVTVHGPSRSLGAGCWWRLASTAAQSHW